MSNYAVLSRAPPLLGMERVPRGPATGQMWKLMSWSMAISSRETTYRAISQLVQVNANLFTTITPKVLTHRAPCSCSTRSPQVVGDAEDVVHVQG